LEKLEAVMKGKLLGLLLCLLPSAFCFGQSISNIRAEQQDSVIRIRYDLDLANASMIKDVKAYIKRGQQSWELCKYVSGDVDTVKTTGVDKAIYFDIFKQFGYQPIQDSISYKVEGTFVLPDTYVQQVKDMPHKKQQHKKKPAVSAAHRSIGLFINYTYSKAAPIGLFVGAGREWGGFLSVKTPFPNKTYKHLAVTGGILFPQLFRVARFYLGPSYGTYAHQENIGGKSWSSPTKETLLGADIGLMLSFKHWNISLDYEIALPSTSGGNFRDISVGIGYNFSI
jgi:hypothetical protein